MRLAPLLALLLAGCSGSTEASSPASNAGADAGSEASADATSEAAPDGAPDVGPDSEQDLETCIWKAQWCHNPGDCVTAIHTVDCCGTLQVIGVNQANMESFNACEQAWQDTLPECGCASQPTTTEGGSEVTDMSKVAAKCTNMTSEGGICQSYLLP